MRLRRQAVDVDIDGGTLTSDAGLLVLREVDRRINFMSRIDKLIPDPRDPRYVTHSQIEMLTSRVFGLAAGYEDVNTITDSSARRGLSSGSRTYSR